MVLITWQAYKKDDLDPIKAQCLIATTAGTGYAVGEKVIKVYNYNSTTWAVDAANPFFYFNVTTDTQLATAPTAAEVDSNFKPCDAKVEVEKEEKFYTDTTSGEITEVYEVVLYDENGQVMGTPYYILADGTGATFTPWSGVVADAPVRVVTWSQLLSVSDAAAVTLTVPAFTAGAHLQVHRGNDIKFTTGTTLPTTTLNGGGFHVEQWENVILHSNQEVLTFKAIAVDNTAPAEIYVEFYNTSIETGI